MILYCSAFSIFDIFQLVHIELFVKPPNSSLRRIVALYINISIFLNAEFAVEYTDCANPLHTI